jgi:hypothetical protein
MKYRTTCRSIFCALRSTGVVCLFPVVLTAAAANGGEIKALKKTGNPSTASESPAEMGLWTLAELQLAMDDDACLVFDTATGQPMVDAGRFNLGIDAKKMSRAISRDSARAAILNTMIYIKYWSDQGKLNGYDIIEEVKSIIRENIEAREKGYSEIDISGSDSVVRTLYVDYYDRCFAKAVNPRYDVIGSTDSMWIDSVFNVIREADFIRPDRVAITDIKARGDPGGEKTKDLAWQRVNYSDLPKPMRQVVDSGKGREGVAAMPFGYFIFRLIGNVVEPEIPFESAKGKLLTLYNRKRISFPKKISEQDIRSYYESHKSEFARADCHVRLWLVPHNRKREIGAAGTELRSFVSDTARYPSIRCMLTDLPDYIHDAVTRIYFLKKKFLMACLPTGFGHAHVLLLDSITVGTPRTFKEVRDGIADNLRSASMVDFRALEKIVSDYIRDQVVAIGYFSSLSQKEPAMSAKELDACIQGRKTAVPADLAENREFLKSQCALAYYLRPYAEWCSRLSVGYSLLSR